MPQMKQLWLPRPQPKSPDGFLPSGLGPARSTWHQWMPGVMLLQLAVDHPGMLHACHPMLGPLQLPLLLPRGCRCVTEALGELLSQLACLTRPQALPQLQLLLAEMAAAAAP